MSAKTRIHAIPAVPSTTPKAGTTGKVAAPLLPALDVERCVYGAPRGAQPKAFVLTLAIHAFVIGAFFLKFSVSYTVAKPSAPLVVSLLPLASPPETPPKLKEATKPVEKKQERKPTPPNVEPIIRTITAMPAPKPEPQTISPPAPTSPQPETAAPKAVLAPPAPQAQSNAPDTWEGRVLARLEKFRRYPGSARGARQQGVVYISFCINRDGHVLTSSLVRSSGFPALDRAALETLRRADPLPKIPVDRPDRIELSVPVEFYIR